MYKIRPCKSLPDDLCTDPCQPTKRGCVARKGKRNEAIARQLYAVKLQTAARSRVIRRASQSKTVAEAVLKLQAAARGRAIRRARCSACTRNGTQCRVPECNVSRALSHMPNLRRALTRVTKVPICERNPSKCCALCSLHLRVAMASVFAEGARVGVPILHRFTAGQFVKYLTGIVPDDYAEAGRGLNLDDIYAKMDSHFA